MVLQYIQPYYNINEIKHKQAISSAHLVEYDNELQWGDWKCRTGIKWTNQIWGLENAGLELKGPSRKTGKCRTGIKRTK